MNYKDNFEMLQKQHKALETKHKNLRGSVSWITNELARSLKLRDLHAVDASSDGF